MLNGSDLLVPALENEGVDRIFRRSGGGEPGCQRKPAQFIHQADLDAP
jgi:hypothetical protein